jgi:hypothetical protein
MTRAKELAGLLRTDADEIAGWGAGNEAGRVREAASLIERLYRERETALNMRDQLAKALRQTCGLVVEFGNLNGFRSLSDEELGSAVMGVAREGARVLNLYDAAIAEQPQ